MISDDNPSFNLYVMFSFCYIVVILDDEVPERSEVLEDF